MTVDALNTKCPMTKSPNHEHLTTDPARVTFTGTNFVQTFLIKHALGVSPDRHLLWQTLGVAQSENRAGNSWPIRGLFNCLYAFAVCVEPDHNDHGIDTRTRSTILHLLVYFVCVRFWTCQVRE